MTIGSDTLAESSVLLLNFLKQMPRNALGLLDIEIFSIG